jgi:hypothetical protein
MHCISSQSLNDSLDGQALGLESVSLHQLHPLCLCFPQLLGINTNTWCAKRAYTAKQQKILAPLQNSLVTTPQPCAPRSRKILPVLPESTEMKCWSEQAACRPVGQVRHEEAAGQASTQAGWLPRCKCTKTLALVPSRMIMVAAAAIESGFRRAAQIRQSGFRRAAQIRQPPGPGDPYNCCCSRLASPALDWMWGSREEEGETNLAPGSPTLAEARRRPLLPRDGREKTPPY